MMKIHAWNLVGGCSAGAAFRAAGGQRRFAFRRFCAGVILPAFNNPAKIRPNPATVIFAQG